MPAEVDDACARNGLQRTAMLLFDQPGRVVELRGLNVPGARGKGTVSGYFDNVVSFVECALTLDRRGASGVYFTLNPVQPELLGRAHNRLVDSPKSTTSDADIVRRLRLLIDLDPKRPSGISSSEAELQLAKELARQVVAFLTANGFPAPARGMSGNGVHAHYGIDLPADDGGLVQRFLHALAYRFNTQKVQIDETVFNAARICKVYGTVARKGDPLPDRPHRRSEIVLPEGGLTVVPTELLKRIADSAPRIGPNDATRETEKLDIDVLLARANIAVSRTGPWSNGTRWVLSTCPFNTEHTDDSAYVLQFASGALAAGCHHNGCSGKSWHDLRDIIDAGWRERAKGTSFSSFSTPPSHSSIAWPIPEPLVDELAPVAPFQDWLLPEGFRPWVRDIAERIQCPPDFPAVSAMISLAGIVGRKIGIRPKRKDDWLVVPNLWGAVIGRPGILKTPAIQEPLKRLKQLEIEAKKAFQAAMATFEAEEMVFDASKKVAAKQIKEDIEGGGDGLAAAQECIEDRPESPTRRRYLVNDPTVEKLGELLNQNPTGVLVFRDELIGLLKSLDKEGQEGARSFYLEAWNGDGRYTYDRIGRGTIDIEAAIVSILGAIQPGPLRSYLYHAVASTLQDDGLMQRFQLAVWPDVSRKWKNVDRWPDSEARKAAHAVFERLDKLVAADYGAQTDESDPDGIPFVHFSPNAQEMFEAWREQLEIKVRSGSEHPAIESHLAKYRSLVPSLALLIHLADDGTSSVGEEALAKAIGWAEYLETHARRIYSVVINADLFAAKALADKILKREVKDGFARHEIYRRGWTNLGGTEHVERAVAVLIDHGWLREVTTKGGAGAPKTVYLINPHVWDLPKSPPEETETSPEADPSFSSFGTSGEGFGDARADGSAA